MARYQLKSGSALIVDVPSNSSLDSPHVQKQRRGSVHRVLGGKNITQYTDVAIGDSRIVWTIPLVNSNEFGRLYSAAIGDFGNSLILTSPIYGDISVAIEPGERGFKPEKHQPRSFGYQVEISFVRLA